MNNTQDLFLVKDILPVFDNTYNDDSKSLLQKLLLNPLTSVQQIEERQQILKSFSAHESLLFEYQYRKADYLEVQRFLLYFSDEDLRAKDYLTYLFNKNKNNTLFGFYSQLIYFFKELEDYLKSYLDRSKFSKTYQQDLSFILNYLNDFKCSETKRKITKNKFGFKSIQRLNALVVEKRKTGDTILFFNKLNTFEVYLSICKSLHKMDLNFVKVGTTEFKLNQFFHPLVNNPVKNDITISANVLLLTGANMSGKSTFLKTIGLCVYLAHVGLPIPASGGSIPFYESISIQINHSDDLKNGYSHFMNEIINLKDVVVNVKSGKLCFAVFDELFKGTNHEDALAISASTLSGLQKFDGSLFIISTHLSELKDKIDHNSVNSFYIECVIEENMPVFSYQLKEGWSNLKIGQLLFNKIGLKTMLS